MAAILGHQRGPAADRGHFENRAHRRACRTDGRCRLAHAPGAISLRERDDIEIGLAVITPMNSELLHRVGRVIDTNTEGQSLVQFTADDGTPYDDEVWFRNSELRRLRDLGSQITTGATVLRMTSDGHVQTLVLTTAPTEEMQDSAALLRPGQMWGCRHQIHFQGGATYQHTSANPSHFWIPSEVANAIETSNP